MCYLFANPIFSFSNSIFYFLRRTFKTLGIFFPLDRLRKEIYEREILALVNKAELLNITDPYNYDFPRTPVSSL